MAVEQYVSKKGNNLDWKGKLHHTSVAWNVPQLAERDCNAKDCQLPTRLMCTKRIYVC